MKFYKCQVCAKEMIIVKEGNPQTICCNQKMIEIPVHIEESKDGEKHLPTYCKRWDKYWITVGEVTHPYHEDHHIEWILIELEDGYIIRYLKPDQEPSICIKICRCSKPVAIYAMCNKHGLWKTNINK